MKKPETVTDDKGNIYIVPGQMTREEAEVYFPNQPERLNPETREPKLVYIEPNPETMSPAMKAKYELAKAITRCDSLNSMET